jgi:hypothetical protein
VEKTAGKGQENQWISHPAKNGQKAFPMVFKRKMAY